MNDIMRQPYTFVYSISKCNSYLQKMDRTLSTIQHIIQRSRERKALPLAPTEADNCYLSARSNEYQDMSQLTAQQRYTIAQLLKQGKTQKEIAHIPVSSATQLQM